MTHPTRTNRCPTAVDCLARRDFLKSSAIGVTTLMLADVFPGRVFGQDAELSVQVATYPRLQIAKASELSPNQPFEFDYPNDEAFNTGCMLFRLGKPAGGGIGEQHDIVAFSSRCTHMGGDLTDGYVVEFSLLGCGEHLSTFDLTRHGMLVAGHATELLPQIILELEGDDIYATGILGLLYGYHQNPSGGQDTAGTKEGQGN